MSCTWQRPSMNAIDEMFAPMRAAHAEKQRKIAETLTPEQRLAKLIHDKTCHWSHVDECFLDDFTYWQWEKNTSELRFLTSARTILTLVGEDETLATNIVAALRPLTAFMN